MVEIINLQLDPNDHERSLRTFTETLDSGTDGKVIKNPGNTSQLTVAIYPEASSSGKFQTTTSSIAAIEADTAEWIDWPDGTVSVDTTRSLIGSYAAFKAVRVTGTIKIEVVT